jgi:predicted ATP-grasp superfamily ATP-dependent carboligase
MRGASDLEGTVLVTDARRGSALAFIRSLGRAGMRVIAADSEPKSPGMRSRDAAASLVYPDPRVAPRGYVEAIQRAVSEQWVDLVIPITDDTMLPLARERQSFGDSLLAIPSPESLALAADKHRTLARAEALGIRTPRTQLVRSADEALAAPLGEGPVVLKPRRSRVVSEAGIDQLEVRYARDRGDLGRAMSELEGRCDVLLQEYVAGTGVGVEVLAHEGRVLAAFAHRRLRELPPQGGRSAFRESIELVPSLFEPSRQLIGDLGFTGLAMVEWKAGSGAPALMEVNGRVWGSLPLAVAAGMDFPAHLASLYLNGPPKVGTPCDTDYARGVRGRNLLLDLKWMANVMLGRRRLDFLPGPRRRDVLGAAASLFDPRIHDDVQSLRDPLPGLTEIWSQLGRRRGRTRTAPGEAALQP